jgi:aquaporin Z
MNLTRRALAELLGTFWLVLGGCGAAVLAAKFPDIGAGIVGVALAFGLSVLSGMYALGAISGGHFNPAITVGLTVARRFPVKEVATYVVAQCAGAILGAVVLYLIASSAPGFDVAVNGFAVNGYGSRSPGEYGLGAALLCEIVMTFMLVMIVLGVTDTRSPMLKGFAPIAIGLALTLIHLVSIPVTNTSVNPARSTGPALIAGAGALNQLWLFWVAPLVGGVVGGVLYRWISADLEVPITGRG